MKEYYQFQSTHKTMVVAKMRTRWNIHTFTDLTIGIAHKNKKLIKMMILIANNLNMKVIAEWWKPRSSMILLLNGDAIIFKGIFCQTNNVE